MHGWPKNANGTTNWDVVFDDPNNGLIPLIKQANTAETLRAVAGLVIEQLFTRRQDDAYRTAYGGVLDTLIPLDGIEEGKSFQGVKAEVAALMATIRDERKRKAAEYIAKKQAEEAAEAAEQERQAAADVELGQDRRDEPSDALELPEESEEDDLEPIDETDAAVVARLFSEAFLRYYQDRFKAFRAGFTDEVFQGAKAPYILSIDFEEHFLRLLNLHFLPELINRCHGLMHRATETSPDKREAFFADSFTNKRSRQELWSRWQLLWDDVLETQDIPPRPEDDGNKNGLLGSLSKLAQKNQKKSPGWRKEELTLPEWKEKAKEIKENNRKVKVVRAALLEEGETYDPPEEVDLQLLKELFGRSPEAITKQKRAIRQIFEQGGNYAQGFDSYMRKTRSIDPSLLSVCYERPDIFFGPKAQLYNAMSGYDDSAKSSLFRLTWRYHGARAEAERKKAI